MAAPDLELSRGWGGGGFVSLALPTFLPSVTFFFFTSFFFCLSWIRHRIGILPAVVGLIVQARNASWSVDSKKLSFAHILTLRACHEHLQNK